MTVLGIEEKEFFASGHRSCAGCGEALALRHILKAAGEKTIIANATGCMEVVSTPYPETAWEVPWIHCAFENAAAVASGIRAALDMKGDKETNVIAMGGDGACYSPDTKILTIDGFKWVADIKKGDAVWSVNPTTLKLELQIVNKLHSFFYEGKMIHAATRYVDFLVTPNHNVPIQSRKTMKVSFIKAGELVKRYKTLLPRKFNWGGKEKQTFILPKVSKKTSQKEYASFKMQDWLEFIGWYVTEGSCYHSDSGYLVRIYQSKKENRKRIFDLTKRMGLKSFECSRSVDISSKQLFLYLKNNCGDYFYNKRVPKEFLELSQRLLKHLFDSMIAGDGSKIKPGKGRTAWRTTYITKSQYLKDAFVELCLKLGKNCCIGLDKNDTMRIGVQEEHIKNELYSTRNFDKAKPQVFEEKYSGMVHCPELLQNHTLIMERNGRVSLSGNSFDIGFGSLSGAFERGTKFLYVCTDNEAYQNCLALDSLIMTKDGLKKITEIKVGDEVYAFSQSTHELVLKKCAGVFDNGVKTVYEVSTGSHTIKATGNHPFLVLQRNGRGNTNQLVWKMVEELEVGDSAVALKKLSEGKSHEFEKLTKSKKGDYKVNKINEITIPEKSSSDLMKLLGIFVGDGWVRTEKAETAFAVPENDKARKITIDLIEKVFNLKPRLHKNEIHLYSVNAANFVNSLGFGKGAKNKTIPSWVFALPAEEKEAFVEGLILSDGCKIENSWGYLSASHELIKRLRLLLQTMNTRVGKIHLSEVKKGKFVVYREILKDSSYSYIAFSTKKGRTAYYPSQYKYDNFLYGNNYFEMRKITSIKRLGPEPTLDLRVEGEHNFVANGLVVHNTGIQRSSATFPYATTTTTPNGKAIHGKQDPKKPLPFIIAAHGARYVASASVMNLFDLKKKVQKALAIDGPTFITVFVPCIPGWKIETSATIELSKKAFETNVYPLYEIENGVLTINQKPEKKAPVEEYLKTQGRFKHLTPDLVEKIQKYVDDRWAFLESIEGKKIFDVLL